ncbi:hypothetical protein LEP1GSC047_2618 [Leptospira inadai serovar Lyme str. 10]|uniref:Uncharacterized protein n=1 Tax=Leptospira inadai serovar Lyme str. 10 TaxID=1049790 RepID=V6HBV0_9LEPT|nr:hypothetical protein LEP1GSC047_2618 [Leptospira inadai serovar Lyme str. 10]
METVDSAKRAVSLCELIKKGPFGPFFISNFTFGSSSIH